MHLNHLLNSFPQWQRVNVVQFSAGGATQKLHVNCERVLGKAPKDNHHQLTTVIFLLAV